MKALPALFQKLQLFFKTRFKILVTFHDIFSEKILISSKMTIKSWFFFQIKLSHSGFGKRTIWTSLDSFIVLKISLKVRNWGKISVFSGENFENVIFKPKFLRWIYSNTMFSCQVITLTTQNSTKNSSRSFFISLMEYYCCI